MGYGIQGGGDGRVGCGAIRVLGKVLVPRGAQAQEARAISALWAKQRWTREIQRGCRKSRHASCNKQTSLSSWIERTKFLLRFTPSFSLVLLL